MRPTLNVLMTGAGAPGGPGIISALSQSEEINLLTADANPGAAGFLLSGTSVVIPKAESTEFISHLLSLCISHQIDILFPLVTAELNVLSHESERFKKIGTVVLVPNASTLDILNDKGRLYQHLQKNLLPHPHFKIATTTAELVAAAKSLDYPTCPIAIKPCQGNGSRGMRILDASIDRYDLLFNHKPTSVYTNLEEVLTAIGNRAIPPMLVSEYLPGDELTIDVIVVRGDVRELLIRTRDTMSGGISTSGRFITHHKVETYIRDILNSLDLHDFCGPIGFQVKRSLSGEYLLLESNPRIQGTSVAALGCGINLPLLAVLSAANRSVSYNKRANVGFKRYYKEAFYEY
jgi:carbamoyl-phosphate synthase large subunit